MNSGRTPNAPRSLNTAKVDGGDTSRQQMFAGSQDVTETEQLQHAALWDLGIAELAGHNIEAQGREEVNKLLAEGWVLLHIYTLQYNDGGVWRQRPMAILGRRKP